MWIEWVKCVFRRVFYPLTSKEMLFYKRIMKIKKRRNRNTPYCLSDPLPHNLTFTTQWLPWRPDWELHNETTESDQSGEMSDGGM